MGRWFQSLGLNCTLARFSPPIRHLKLLFRSMNTQPGSDIFPNSRSSLASLLSSLCSTQFSTQQFTTDTRFTYKTECLYASTRMSGNTCTTVGPFTTVTNWLSPKIRASGWHSPHLFTSLLLEIGLFSPKWSTMAFPTPLHFALT